MNDTGVIRLRAQYAMERVGATTTRGGPVGVGALWRPGGGRVAAGWGPVAAGWGPVGGRVSASGRP